MSKFLGPLLYDDHYPAGFLVIEAPNKKRFLQFRRYTREGNSGLRFDFPLAPWSEKYYEIMKGVFYDRGINYEVEKTDQEIVVAFLTVDLRQDLPRAMELAKLVLLEVFQLQPEDRIKLYLVPETAENQHTLDSSWFS